MCICKPFPFVALLRQTVDFCCNELIGVGWSAESSIKADLLADNFFEAQKYFAKFKSNDVQCGDAKSCRLSGYCHHYVCITTMMIIRFQRSVKC